MHKKLVLNVVSRILLVVCLSMVLPLGWAFVEDYSSTETRAFLVAMLGGFVFTFLVRKFFPVSMDEMEELNAKDGLAIVGLSWIFISVFGAVPFFLSGAVPSYTDAFFETASGFTTTGATVITRIEALPRGILFWRSLTHWLGGMGIIVLSVALLPALGRGAYQLYRAEAPGPTAERVRPKMKETAKTLWMVYFILSFAETVLLMAGGMPLFDAMCHTFGTMATGGFSTKNASIAAYGPYIQWVIIGFMLMAGANFQLHYQALRGQVRSYTRSEEFRTYLLLILTCVPVFTAILYLTSGSLGEEVLRTAAFQVVSILTTTGYTTADFNLWPAFLKVVLVILMFIGGCAGSTGGGMKVIRVWVALKSGYRSVRQALLPNAVMHVKIDAKPVSDSYVLMATTYFLIYVSLFGLGTVFMTLSESTDLVTAFAASVACLSNIGPGLGEVGAVENYAWISIPGKWLLSFLMLAGRLELYSILVLLLPSTWRK
ncbi:MAG: TrkH family potassium uptake protein [bacterium]|nr:MAG: TrkH family potassium uptake protein [bacterium]